MHQVVAVLVEKKKDTHIASVISKAQEVVKEKEGKVFDYYQSPLYRWDLNLKDAIAVIKTDVGPLVIFDLASNMGIEILTKLWYAMYREVKNDIEKLKQFFEKNKDIPTRILATRWMEDFHARFWAYYLSLENVPDNQIFDEDGEPIVGPSELCKYLKNRDKYYIIPFDVHV